MPKTRIDIIHMAARHLGVASQNEPLVGVDFEATADAYDAAVDLLAVDQGLTLPATTPDGLALGISRLTAVLVGPHFQIATEPQSRAVMRCRSYLLPDDRDDSRDIDDDGIVTEAEVEAGLRALYY